MSMRSLFVFQTKRLQVQVQIEILIDSLEKKDMLESNDNIYTFTIVRR